MFSKSMIIAKYISRQISIYQIHNVSYKDQQIYRPITMQKMHLSMVILKIKVFPFRPWPWPS